MVDAQSGSSSDLGQFEYRGVKLAVDQANAAGGVDGRKITLSLLDDQGDPTVGTELARKIASQGDVAMLGTAESAVTLAMAPILQSEHIPNITSGQSTKLLALNSPYLFLNGPTGLTYDSTLAKYLVQTKGYKKIAMLTNNDSYGAGEHDAFLSSLKTLGVTPVADKVVPQDQTNMTPALTAIRGSEPAGPVHRGGGGAVRADGQAGPRARHDRGHRRGRPGRARRCTCPRPACANANGTIVSSPYLGNDVSAAAKKFAAAYTAAYGSAPELHGAKAYDGAAGDDRRAEGLPRLHRAGAGQRDPRGALRRAARLVRYDKQGVGIFATSIGIIKNGKIEPVS